jgi:xylulokinase
MALLGIDVGTSGCKATAFDTDGKILAAAAGEYPPTVCPPGYLEINPDLVWRAVADSIRRCAAACAEPILGLAVSSFGEAAVPIDRSGQALANGILFIDPRGQAQADRMADRLGAHELAMRTGLPLHRMYTLFRLMWLRDEQPEIYRRTWKYLQFEDLVLYRLTGETVTDYSLADRTMAFNVLDKTWDPVILAAADLPDRIWARPLPSGTVAGAITRAAAAAVGLPAGTPVVTGGHDQPCTALGSGIIRTGQAIDGIGTSECITTCFDQPVLNDRLFARNYHCGPHTAPGQYITFAYTMSAGALLQWFRDTIGRPERDEAARSGLSAYALLDSRVQREPTNLLILPHFDGGGTPSLDPASRGAILGLSRQTTPLEIYRAMLESVTYEMRYNLACLEEAGIRVETLRAAGGGAKSPVWLQIKADILGRPIATLTVDEAGTLGGAILAGVATGVFRDVRMACAQMVHEKRQFWPDQTYSERYEAAYRKYCQLYPALKAIYN